jgi:L-fuculose-phosphate aldolase
MPFNPPDEEQVKSVILKILSEIPGNYTASQVEMITREAAIRYFACIEKISICTDISEAAQHLYDLGFFPGTSGNISARLSDGSILITPSGVSKKKLQGDNILRVNPEGEPVDSSSYKPSSEMKMHLQAYRKRPDIGGIVHAHPPFSTGLAAAGVLPDTSLLPEAVLILGRVPLVEYSTPSTWEVPKKLEPYLDNHNVFLMANHGALTLGRDIAEACHRMETLEFFAKVLFICRMLGEEKYLDSDRIRQLLEASSLLSRN